MQRSSCMKKICDNHPFDVVIPARYESSRLPGKALEIIVGKSLIQRVVECAQASRAERVIVATDSEQIEEEVYRNTTAEVCRTSREHNTGTDRIAEAVDRLNLDENRIIVNVQGDEPMLQGELIDCVAMKLANCEEAVMATAVRGLEEGDELYNPNVVKCSIDSDNYAENFSRQPIQSLKSNSCYAHIGIYAYKVWYLKQFVGMNQTKLEKAERLEQLRVIESGGKIVVYVSEDYRGIGVDTLQDLERAREYFLKQIAK